jgi:hypothetical protein
MLPGGPTTYWIGAAMVAVPSPLVSPPTLSSCIEVNVIGNAAVPCARKIPAT